MRDELKMEIYEESGKKDGGAKTAHIGIIRHHLYLWTYCENLTRTDMINIACSLYPPTEFKKEYQVMDKKYLTKEQFLPIFFYLLTSRYDTEYDVMVVDWCDDTLKKIKEGKLEETPMEQPVEIKPFDDLKEFPEETITPFYVSFEDFKKLDNYRCINKDLLGMFCSFVLGINGYFSDAFKTTEELSQSSLLKVIQKEIRIDKVISEMEDFINYNMFNSEKQMLGELCQKFNLNMRIHIWDTRNLKEVLMREDNDGWLMPQKEDTVNFEIGKYGNQFFPYYFMDIKKNILYDPFRLIAFCQYSAFDGYNHLVTHSESSEVSTLRFVVNLIRLGFLTKHDEGKNKKILKYFQNNFFYPYGDLCILHNTGKLGQAAIELGIFSMKPDTQIIQ